MLAGGVGFAFKGPAPGVNAAPVAEPDFYAVPAGDGLIGFPPGVLANDSDPDGDPIYAILVTDAAHGEVSLGLFGELSYTPEIGFAGVDRFQYQAFDGTSYSEATTVEITVERIEINGTDSVNRLVGTANAEIFRPGAGPRDHIFLGGGMDIVAFGDEARNGVAEITRIFGFGPDDSLDLGGASVVAVREQKNGWLRLTLDGDGDIILLENLTRADIDSLI
jgi:hypothetical protein